MVSAFAQVGIRSKLLERRNPYSRVTYTDPSTARVVVSKFGVIPLPDEHHVDASPAWQLKIRDLNSNNQSELALAMRHELAGIRAELSQRAQHGYVKRRTDKKGKCATARKRSWASWRSTRKTSRGDRDGADRPPAPPGTRRDGADRPPAPLDNRRDFTDQSPVSGPSY